MITFTRNSTQFKYRTAAVIQSDDHILLNQQHGESFWVLPGKRVDMLESTRQALQRELNERFQVTPEIIRLIWVVESFYQQNKLHMHELAFYYEVKLPIQATMPIQHTDSIYQWISLRDMDTIDIRPPFLKLRLDDLPHEIEHFVID